MDSKVTTMPCDCTADLCKKIKSIQYELSIVNESAPVTNYQWEAALLPGERCLNLECSICRI